VEFELAIVLDDEGNWDVGRWEDRVDNYVALAGDECLRTIKLTVTAAPPAVTEVKVHLDDDADAAVEVIQGSLAYGRQRHRTLRRRDQVHRNLRSTGEEPQPGTRDLNQDEFQQWEDHLRAKFTAESYSGHGHARHGSQTTMNEQIRRVRTGEDPDGTVTINKHTGARERPSKATKFDTHSKEVEAVERARGKIGPSEPKFDKHGQPRFIKIVVDDGAEGYGSGVRVKEGPDGEPFRKGLSNPRASNPTQPLFSGTMRPLTAGGRIRNIRAMTSDVMNVDPRFLKEFGILFHVDVIDFGDDEQIMEHATTLADETAGWPQAAEILRQLQSITETRHRADVAQFRRATDLDWYADEGSTNLLFDILAAIRDRLALSLKQVELFQNATQGRR
jgi:hypothetical protein